MSSEPQGSGSKDLFSGRPFFSRPVGKIVVIWAAMTVVGMLIGFYVPGALMPRMLSVEGHVDVLTIILFTVLAAPVAALVYGIGFYSLFAWRQKGYGRSDTPPPDGPPLRGNSAVTVVWMVTSAILVIVLLVWGLAEYTAADTPHPNALVVDVIGQQWVWTFKYPGTGVESRILELPVNRPVQFDVTSEDVTHGFWVPSLGVQVDANPEVTTVVRATTDQTGTLWVRCSQLCGLYHSFMVTRGHVTTAAAFSKWLQRQGATSSSANVTADVNPG